MTERLTKQQLKEDPLMKKTGDVLDFVRQYSRLLIGGGVGLLILGGIFLMTRSASDRAEERAAEMLAEAQGDLARGALDPAADRLSEILTTVGGTRGGKRALLVLADVRYAQKRFPEAEDAYRRAVDALHSSAALHTAARNGLAASLENLGTHLEAAALYLALSEDARAEALRKDLSLSAARNYFKAGNLSEAESIYQRLSDDPLDTSTAAQEAQLRLAEIRIRRAG